VSHCTSSFTWDVPLGTRARVDARTVARTREDEVKNTIHRSPARVAPSRRRVVVRGRANVDALDTETAVKSERKTRA